MSFLASDALRGRGSGTPDELLAATYVGSQLQQYGIDPPAMTAPTSSAPPSSNRFLPRRHNCIS